jgi:hypothetical protein
MLRSQGTEVPATYEDDFRRVRLFVSLCFVDDAGGPHLPTSEGVGSAQPQDRAGHTLHSW